MERVIRNGMVAVLVSPGFGAGWSTWGGGEWALFSPDVVAWVEAGKPGDIDNIIAANPDAPAFYTGGAKGLEIEWVPVGTQFRIVEYDGSESLITNNDDYWNIA